MATFNKFQQFVEDVAHGVHDLETNQLMVALTNTGPAATNETLSQITEITYTNLSGVNPRNLTTSSSAHTTGTYKLVIADLTLTASGGSVGPFRYAVIYNDTPTSPADPLIGWYDYGSSITLAAGETLLLDFDGSGGLLTLA
jgi:hypothetical protein